MLSMKTYLCYTEQIWIYILFLILMPVVVVIVNYINKSDRGVSKLLSVAMEEIRGGNVTIRQKLQHIGYKFISASEVLAQEASYCRLGLRLSESSNVEVYINTYKKDNRISILKSKKDLANMRPDDTDIFIAGLIYYGCHGEHVSC